MRNLSQLLKNYVERDKVKKATIVIRVKFLKTMFKGIAFKNSPLTRIKSCCAFAIDLK